MSAIAPLAAPQVPLSLATEYTGVHLVEMSSNFDPELSYRLWLWLPRSGTHCLILCDLCSIKVIKPFSSQIQACGAKHLI